LTGTNTYTGGTVIAAGTLELGSGASILGDVTFQDSGRGGCATSVGMLLRPGGHGVLAPRRGVWVPHGIVPAEFSTRSLLSPNHVPVLPVLLGGLTGCLGPHAGGRRSGLASLERDPDAGRDREQEWPVTAVLVEPAVGEFPDLSAPGLLERAGQQDIH
jgi:hypothetical protein